MSKNTREISLDILLDIEKNNKYTKSALDTALVANQFMEKQERALISRLVEGVTEQRIRLDYIADCFIKNGIKKCRPVIRCVIRMGIYEIFYMDSIPESATCNEYVKLVEKRGMGKLKGFVNGILRNVCRNQNQIVFPDKSNYVNYLSVAYSVPERLIKVLLRDYDADTLEQILGSSNEDRKTAVRVNTDKISVADFTDMLKKSKINVERGAYNDTSLLIDGYDYIRRVPGFFEGYFVVQDESSCMAVRCAGIKEGFQVLDLCGAPGGKSVFAASLAGKTGEVISRDLTEEKVALIEENMERLGISNMKAEVYDASKYDENMENFADVVIADLPCSGLGIMGRKNDIRYRIDESAIFELAGIQRSILKNAVRYVKPGGTLLFSTCTINSKENEENVQWITEHYDFETESLENYLPETLKDRGKKGYITLCQGIDRCDGFFIARFRRKDA